MKKKKSLVALLLVAIIGIVGGTFALFSSDDTFTNIFGTATYNVSAIEQFVSPSEWKPGDDTAKRVYVTNNGNVEVAVRVWYEESWVDSQSRSLPLTVNDESVSIIKHPNNFSSNWTKSTENGTDYYYYKTRLAADATTTDFMSSVQFNPIIDINTDHDCTTSNGVKTCTTVSKDYGGGTYTLTVHVETVQYNSYADFWSTDVVIS